MRFWDFGTLAVCGLGFCGFVILGFLGSGKLAGLGEWDTLRVGGMREKKGVEKWEETEVFLQWSLT